MRIPLAGAMAASLAGLVASALTITAAPAAHADVSATIQVATPVAVPGECFDYRVDYDMNLPPGASGWFAELKATSAGKGGRSSTDISYFETTGDSGYTTIDLCVFTKKDMKVNLTLTGSYDDATGGGTITAELPVKLKAAKTRAKLVVSNPAPTFNQVIRLNGRVQYYHADFTAWYALESASAHLQLRTRGRWVTFGPELIPAANGTDHVDYRWNVRGTYRVRLLVPAANGHARSVSNTVTIRTR